MNTYRMATAKGLDVEECKDLVTLKELEGRDITCADVSCTATDDVYGELRVCLGK